MTDSMMPGRPWPAAIVLAGLALAGCSGANVGSAWQCPLAQGGSCDSVAGADPAVPQAASVPDAVPADGMTIREPLYRARGGARAGPAARTCEADCDRDFDPFGWLVRLFEADDGSGARPGRDPGTGAREDGGDDSRPADAGAMRIAPGAEAASAQGAGADPAVESAIGTPALPAGPETMALPGALEPVAGLRTEEVVARIWIAPFVDANGVYREGSHVRVVLKPAGWRVP